VTTKLVNLPDKLTVPIDFMASISDGFPSLFTANSAIREVPSPLFYILKGEMGGITKKKKKKI
jgi:hypothetical protein